MVHLKAGVEATQTANQVVAERPTAAFTGSHPIAAQSVDIMGVRFPRLTQAQAVDLLLTRLTSGMGAGVCFPDMSTLNIAASDPEFLTMLQDKVLTLNDGIGLGTVACLRGAPFQANLNGTDLCPMLLRKLPAQTRVFALGAAEDVLERAVAKLKDDHPHVQFVGHRHGYFDADQDAEVADMVRAARPDVVLVGMGNPRQVNWIVRHQDHPDFAHTLFLAVGGMFHYHSGDLRRVAPAWRRFGLEWLGIVLQQPHKFKRYVLGIPRFLLRAAMYSALGLHDLRRSTYGDRVLGSHLTDR
jgi:exopolysaccharide biosynthesis WecB/TagA/CpsF family protein